MSLFADLVNRIDMVVNECWAVMDRIGGDAVRQHYESNKFTLGYVSAGTVQNKQYSSYAQ